MPGPDASEGALALVTVVASDRPADGGTKGDVEGSEADGTGGDARSGAGSSGKASHSASGLGFSTTA